MAREERRKWRRQPVVATRRAFKAKVALEAVRTSAGPRLRLRRQDPDPPQRIYAANRAYSPDDAEVAHARAVIAAFVEPENAGRGAIRVKGNMADRLHLMEAEKVVALAEAAR